MENEGLDPLYAAVFENPENGTPDNISQAGCLALARLEKEAWNAWRLKYPVEIIKKNEPKSWRNVANFSEARFIDSANFYGFIFGDGALFENVKFETNTIFNQASFGDKAKFNNANFSRVVSFSRVRFEGEVRFDNSNFVGSADFQAAYFDGDASFLKVNFQTFTIFKSAFFNNEANFKRVVFGEFSKPDFQGAIFNKKVNFDGAQFECSANFNGVDFNDISFLTDELTDFDLIQKDLQLTLDGKRKINGKGNDIFKNISFDGATFRGRVNFSGRTFFGETSFGRLIEEISTLEYLDSQRQQGKKLPIGHPVTFNKAPLFHNCKLHQDTTFDGAIFPEPSSNPTENDIASRAYRTLKLAFSQHQAIREEQRFFRLEMAEEAARAPGKLKWMFWLYSYFSNYGFSLSRPMVLLLATLPIFSLVYSGLADFTPCRLWAEDCQIKSELLQFTLMQALPLPGFDKWSESLREVLFPKDGWQSVLLTVFVMLHKAIALLAVFLFGLALRNLFKMK